MGAIMTASQRVPSRSTTDACATASEEIPLYLPAGEEHVFAIATQPSSPANGVGVLCLHAGGANDQTSHRNRLYTRLCREVAGAGCMALRMDYHGTGDSSGVLLDRDVFGQTAEDVRAAVRWLTEHGAERIVAVGTCWGALVALASAAQDAVIVSLCLISPPLVLMEKESSTPKRRTPHEHLVRTLRQGFRPRVLRLLLVEREYRRWVLRRIHRRVRRALVQRGWASSSAHDDEHIQASRRALFTPLMRRRVPLRLLYGEEDQWYQDLIQRGGLPFLESASEIVDFTVMPARVHGLTTVHAQEAALAHVRECLARDVGVTVPARDGGGLPG
jgi:pimeloyl-ACP methyl ester carboxylesterase